MKKKIILPGMLLLLFLGLGMVSRAAQPEPTVTFDGKQIVYSNYDRADFGDAFDDMLPSETRTQEIVLKNAAERAVDFYMSAQVLKSLQQIGADNAFYHVSLQLVQKDVSTEIYGSGQETAAVGGSNKGGRGLHELDDTLNTYDLLAVLQAGETAKLKLTIELDGESGDNVYMAQNGTLQFDFRVQYDDPKAPEVITVKKDPVVRVVQKVQTVYRGVKTGDGAPVGIIVVLLAISLFLILFLLFRRKKTGERIWMLLLLAGLLFAGKGKIARAAELLPERTVRTYTVTYRPGRIGSFEAGTADRYRGYPGVVGVQETKTGSIALTVLAGSALPDPPMEQVKIKEEYAGSYVMNTSWLPGAEEQTVTRDRDYVVDYSTISEETSYSVRYVDTANQQEVAPVFHGRGNVGDAIAQVAKTVNGYQYDAYRKTLAALSADSSKNQITFYYTSTSSGGGEQEIRYEPGGEITRVETTENVIYVGGGQNTRSTAAAGTPAAASGQENGDTSGQESSTEATTEENPEEPRTDVENGEEDLYEIPDEQTPLGDLKEETKAEPSHRSVLPYVCGGVLAAVVLIGLLIRRKRNLK